MRMNLVAILRAVQVYNQAKLLNGIISPNYFVMESI